MEHTAGAETQAHVPAAYSKQLGEGWAGDDSLGLQTLVMQSKDPKWDADPAGEAATSSRASLQDPMVHIGRKGG